MTTLLIATRNAHKVGEIAAVLGAGLRYLDLSAFPEAPPVVENETTFAKNAAKKARDLARWLQGRPAVDLRIPGDHAWILADDSGLEVDALGGAPGVHSARFAHLGEPSPGGRAIVTGAGNASDIENNRKLLGLLEKIPMEQRTARFRCALSLVRIKPAQPTIAGQSFEGVCEGMILPRPQGSGGFGYDPLFLPAGEQRTFGELSEAEKNGISHRAQALAQVRNYLQVLRQL